MGVGGRRTCAGPLGATASQSIEKFTSRYLFTPNAHTLTPDELSFWRSDMTFGQEPGEY